MLPSLTLAMPRNVASTTTQRPIHFSIGSSSLTSISGMSGIIGSSFLNEEPRGWSLPQLHRHFLSDGLVRIEIRDRDRHFHRAVRNELVNAAGFVVEEDRTHA